MNWGNGYRREERPRVVPGDYRVSIVEVEEATSKTSKLPMLVITVQPNGSDIKIKQYIVQNEWFNRNITDFFDSFNIDEGDFNLLTWPGAIGAAKLREDEQGYMKVHYFIHRDKQDELPAWDGPLPERQTVDTSFAVAESGFTQVDEDELPFD